MHKHLLKCLLFIVILSSCSSSRHQEHADKFKGHDLSIMAPVTSSFNDVDTTLIMRPDLPDGKLAVSLTELPRNEDGAFVLAAGLYEADFKTYCLQPGTPGPSANDVYFQAPLEGARKEVIQTILTNSRKQSQLEQKNIQLLLWSIISHSDFYKLAPEVQYTAAQLLSPKQLFQLQGGVMGVVKTVARVVPNSDSQSDFRRLFDLGISSYEAFERLAVVNTPAQVLRTDIKQDQWYRQQDGYYVRYLPLNYKQMKIQVYVPESVVDTAANGSGNYIVFDPTSWVVVAANTNAQRIGIGGPLLDIVKAVIRTVNTGDKGRSSKNTNKGKPATLK